MSGSPSRAVVSWRGDVPAFHELAACLRDEHGAATLELVRGDATRWEELRIVHEDGPTIARARRHDVASGRSPALAFLDAALAGALPESGAAWVRDRLAEARVVVVFDPDEGLFLDEGEDALRTVAHAVFCRGGALAWTCDEGFTNDAGYHVVWGFPEDTTGPWTLAVREGERWAQFQMDLGDRARRAEFLAGRVPTGVARE